MDCRTSTYEGKTVVGVSEGTETRSLLSLYHKNPPAQHFMEFYTPRTSESTDLDSHDQVTLRNSGTDRLREGRYYGNV